MWHRAGTISVTKGSTTVTGKDTGWVEGIRVGDGLQAPDGRMYEITNVASNTSLSITPAYIGATASTQAYWVIPVQGYVKRSADRLAAITDEIEDMPSDIADNKRRLTNAEQTLGNLGAAATSNVVESATDNTNGRLISTNWHGFSSPIAISTEPLAEQVVSGLSVKSRGSTAGRPEDSPFNTGIYKLLELGAASWPTQIAFNGAGAPEVELRNKTTTTAGGPFTPWVRLLTTGNTTADSNGFIKKASPIINLYTDKITKTDHLEIEDAVFECLGVGHYQIKNCPALSRDGWYIETPKDRNGNIYFTLDYEEADGVLTIRTYTPDYRAGPAMNGDPVDIMDGRFVSLRFAEDASLYPDPKIPEEDEPAA